MDFVVFVLIMAGSLGIVLIVYALVHLQNSKMVTTTAVDDEPEDVLNELNDMSKQVFNELDGKYQELLFLYKLISDKKDELAETVIPGKPVTHTAITGSSSKVDISVNDFTSSIDINNGESTTDYIIDDRSALLTVLSGGKTKRIIDLHKKGMGVDEIAKSLSVGKGEVMMAIDLSGMAHKREKRNE